MGKWLWIRVLAIAGALTIGGTGLVIVAAGEWLNRATPREVRIAQSDRVHRAARARGVPSEDIWLASEGSLRVRASRYEPLTTQKSLGRCLVIAHGLHASRATMGNRADAFRRRGYHVLTVDLPAHGASEGVRYGYGVRESFALDLAVDECERMTPGGRVGVIGRSLGGAAFLFSDASRRVGAAVLESVHLDFDSALGNRLELHLGDAGALLGPLLSWRARQLLGEVSALAPIDKMSRLGIPLLLISGALDRRTRAAETVALLAATEGAQPAQLWLVPGAGHEDLHRYDPQTYEAAVSRFLTLHLGKVAERRAVSTQDPHQMSLKACPDRPNCVSSDARDERHGVAPFTTTAAGEVDWRGVRDVVASVERTRIVAFESHYLRAEFTSRWFRFVDDLDLQWRPNDGLIAVRSASRTGYYDWGANRRRVEHLRRLMRAKNIIQ